MKKEILTFCFKKKFLIKEALFFTALLFAFSVTASEDNLEASSGSGYSQVVTASDELRVSTYNVFNLFDAKDDVKNQDPTFLPKGHPKKANCEKIHSKFYKKLCKSVDWTEDKFRKRVGLLAEAVLSQGAVPDILGLQEIESPKAVRAMAQALGYGADHFFMSRGSDRRGINVALLYKTDKLEPLSHRFIQSRLMKRDVLIVRFKVKPKKGFVLDVYVNHWPSQFSGDAERRYKIGLLLQKDVKKQQQDMGGSYGAIVLGDFNVLSTESPNGVIHALQDPSWKRHLIDVYSFFSRDLSIKIPSGTYWYKKRKRWNRLDRILFTKNMKEKEFQPLGKTLRIGHPTLFKETEVSSYLVNGSIKTPYFYDFFKEDAEGYSESSSLICKL